MPVNFHHLAEMVYDPSSQLVAAETRKGPSGKGGAMEGADASQNGLLYAFNLGFLEIYSQARTPAGKSGQIVFLEERS